MKVVILAGGYGTRFGRATDFVPKPMIPVGPMPILVHLMRYYASFGHNEFVLATGYKSEMIKEYFLNMRVYSQDFFVDFGKREGNVTFHSNGDFCPKVTIAYTGQETQTGGRVKRIERYLGDDPAFLLTYGDGLTNLDINETIAFHRSHGKLATLTAVHPPPKFGNLQFSGDQVTSFTEKEGKEGSLVNGGFYVMQREVMNYLTTDRTCILEKEPMVKLANEGQLMAYRHAGYWQCMDTTRDMESLKQVWESGNAPWKRWSDGYVD